MPYRYIWNVIKTSKGIRTLSSTVCTMVISTFIKIVTDTYLANKYKLILLKTCKNYNNHVGKNGRRLSDRYLVLLL